MAEGSGHGQAGLSIAMIVAMRALSMQARSLARIGFRDMAIMNWLLFSASVDLICYTRFATQEELSPRP